MATDDPLPRLVQSLPQELFDEIFNLVFTSLTSTRGTIDKNHKPPSELQVNHSTREQFAQVYFREVTFTLPAQTAPEHWVDSMPMQHLKLVNRVHMLHEPQSEIPLERSFKLSVDFWMAMRTRDCGHPDTFRITDLAPRFRGKFSLQANESKTRVFQKWLAVGDADRSGVLLTKLGEGPEQASQGQKVCSSEG